MLGGYYLGHLYLGESGTFSADELVVQDSRHLHYSDNVAIVEHKTLAVDDTLHAHTADEVALTEHKTLVVDNTIHAHTVDNLTIVQQHTIAIQDTLHAHTADNVTITQVHNLVIDDTLHGHTVDSPTLVQAMILSIDSTRHTSTSDVIVIVEHKLLEIDSTRHKVRSDVTTVFNWDELGVFFGRYLDDYKNFGSFTDEQVAEIGFLYNKYVQSNITLEEFEAELGNYVQQFVKTGDLDDTNNTQSGAMIVGYFDRGDLSADKIRVQLMFEDGFVWLSEDEQSIIVQEYNLKDKIETVSGTGTFKEGKIEYGELQEAV